MTDWEFWIDVGGTFTDCIAKSQTGELRPIKVLSSGVTKGQVDELQGTNRLVDSRRQQDAVHFWVGYDIRFFDERGETIFTTQVASFHPRVGVIGTSVLLPPNLGPGTRYELSAGEEAPILAIRTALGLRRDEAIPPVTVRLGTTRGTNALLTRQGAKTVFVTTRGFADVLLIANQDRPRLFDLDIVKPEPLFANVLEIDERIDANGEVLKAPNEVEIREQLVALKSVVSGQLPLTTNSVTTNNGPHTTDKEQTASLAICLLHSFANPAHEQLVERIAREVGFTEISVSSRLAPLIKIVSRGDTTVMDAYLNPILREYVGRLRQQLTAVTATGETEKRSDGETVICEDREHAVDTDTIKRQTLNDADVDVVTRSDSEELEQAEPVRDSLADAAGDWPSVVKVSGTSLKLMTSSGGLTDANRFVGKDSILSGPAGGVIGFSKVARQAGFTHAIGFDMGGTSTDVARFDGEFEYEFETKKAGVRIVAPMLAIETVAAGGGSICDFDGIKLVVGPQSAGADPGPACYGKGGPLTVTDLNVWLGRIVPERFPFPLDRTAIERRLSELQERMQPSKAHQLSDGTDQVDEPRPPKLSDQSHPTNQSDELAAGLCRIANANMVRAIRKISVARGYDPADYVLVCFGGAGAQHACEIAAQLGIKRILIHPLASLLSAYGIGLADVRRFEERSVLKPYDEMSRREIRELDNSESDHPGIYSRPSALDTIFAELEQAARAEVLAEGIAPENIQSAIPSLDLRYVGVDAAIRVTCPPDGDYAKKYLELHQQLYGYVHNDRTLEVTAARVEVVGKTTEFMTSKREFVSRQPNPDETTRTFFDGAWHSTSIYFRENLAPGDKLKGPALISEASSTIVLEPRWSARVLERGEILIQTPEGTNRRKRIQPVQEVKPKAITRLPHSTVEMRVSAFRKYLSSIHVGMNRDRALVALEAFTMVGPFDTEKLLDRMAGSLKGRLVARPRIMRCLRQLSESGLLVTRLENGRDLFESADESVFAQALVEHARPERSGRRQVSALAAKPQATSNTPPKAECDPVLLEIFNNLFASVAEQMGVTLQMTSCSTNVKERLDFSCAIFDPHGDLVVNAPHIPVHLGAMSETVKRIIEDNRVVQQSDEVVGHVSNVPVMSTLETCSTSIQPASNHNTPTVNDVEQASGLHSGDVFITNDPYRGGSHLPDVTVVTPVHDASGQLIFFTASRAHHAEIGGIVPGSMPPFSKTLGEEGVLIRNFKLVAAGVSREDELQALLQSGPYPTRSVNDNLADVRAQVAANQLGVRQLQELVGKHSMPVVQAYMSHIQKAASTKMCKALAAIPDGVYMRTDQLDDGSPIHATITIHGDSATVDFTGTGPVLTTNLNANRAIVSAAVMYVFRCLINEDIPLNSGVMEPIEIILPECLLNPPENSDPAQSAAVVGGNVETSQRVVDTLLGALGVAAASQGTMNNLTFGDSTFGYYETICGGSGATPTANGADAVHTHMTNTRLTDVEVIERRYPVRVHEFSIRKGSGGTGQHHGGDGITRKIEFLKPLNVSLLTERRGPFAPFGLNGGQPGSLGRNTLLKTGTSEAIDLCGKAQIQVQPGDVLTIETPGGGGHGS